MKTAAINFIDVMRKGSVWGKVLLLLGMIGPCGFFLDVKPLRGLALAWMVSPVPVVFSDVNGYEAFGSTFLLEFSFMDGTKLIKNVTYKEGAEIQGPYNRRNVYGAVIGYAPRIPAPIFQSVMKHAFCRKSILIEEFNLPSDVASVKLFVQDHTAGREHLSYSYEVVCSH